MIALRYTDAPPPDVSGRIVVGLDTWVWRRFAEAQRTGNAVYISALNELEQRVLSSQIVVPLAPTVFFETHAWSPVLRKETASIAERLSGWLTFLSPHVRIRHEMDRALREMFGRPLVLPPRPPDVGWGAHFSMTGITQRLALRGSDDEIAAFIAARGVDSVRRQLEALENYGERQFLEGPSSSQEIQVLRDDYGYRPESAWEVAVERKDRHLLMQQNLASNADLRSRPRDLVNASELGVEINDILNERLMNAGIAADELLDRGSNGLIEFLNLLPSSTVRRSIILRAISDRARPFSVNDLGDADLYAAVVPASDLVIAEKAALRALSSFEVKQKCPAQVIGGRNLHQLPQLLDALEDARQS